MKRTEQREHIFCMLFRKEFYQTETEFNEQVEAYLDDLKADNEEATALSMKDQTYMEEKVDAIYAKITELDEMINSVARKWKTTRMSKVDLTILRLAAYEMKFDDSVPEKVAINEAVELAHKFSSDESPAFINGILAKLVSEEKDA